MISIDPRDPRRRRVGMGRGARDACTRYEVNAASTVACLLSLWPETGRTHQLRVHAAAAACPLLGDVQYGGSKRITLPNGQVIPVNRVMLHCREVQIPRVDAPGHFRFEAPLPQDMRAVIDGGFSSMNIDSDEL